jgi:Na+-driven multidrug efflux pump
MDLETKDMLIISLGLLGWIWAVIQHILNRINQKKDKAIEKNLRYIQISWIKQMK